MNLFNQEVIVEERGEWDREKMQELGLELELGSSQAIFFTLHYS